MLAETHSGARRRAVTVRMFLRGELPFARPPVRQRVKRLKALLRRAVADESTGLRLDDLGAAAPAGRPRPRCLDALGRANWRVYRSKRAALPLGFYHHVDYHE